MAHFTIRKLERQSTITLIQKGVVMKIQEILDKIDGNLLSVPAFQREYVWKRDDAKSLIDSLIKEYPTGTMLTWETSNPPELKGQSKQTSAQGAVKLLLDGQQRITTLYLLIRDNVPPYYKSSEITRDPRGLYVNVETLDLSYYQKILMQSEPRWRNITEIFQGNITGFEIISDLESHGCELDIQTKRRIDENVKTIGQVVKKDFPEQEIPTKATIRQAIDIFYKVNSSGVALTEAELALAQISGYWPQARDIFKAKLVDFADKGYVLNLDFIMYVLLGCLYHMGSDMSKLHGEENKKKLQEAWDSLSTDILDYVVNLLKGRAFVDHTYEINSIYALIPIIVFFYDQLNSHNSISDVQIRRIVKWFYYSQIRARYSHRPRQNLDFDLRVINESNRPFEELLTNISKESNLEILPDEFVGRSISHPLFGLMRWYFKSRHAICFSTGLSLRKNMGEKYQLENDHIFPYSHLKQEGFGHENKIKYALAQELTNRAILTQIANRQKSAKPAAGFLLKTKQQFPHALEKQCIPPNENLWEVEHYEDFLAARRELLATQLNAFLTGLTTSVNETFGAATLEERIAEGEGEELEFKSSMRWDYKTGEVNKNLETVISKTIAGFTNSNGGTLLIGVSDSGESLGLENDYGWLAGDRDRFELHLRNLINRDFNKAFAANYIKVKFPLVDRCEICQVDVDRSSSPKIVKVKNNSGAVQEKFYVRSGNSTQELSLSDFDNYRTERFD